MSTPFCNCRLLWFCVLTCLSPCAQAVVLIDDFTQGHAVIAGDSTVVQTGLDPLHTIGGVRKVTTVLPGDHAEITTANNLSYQSAEGSGMLLEFGSENPLGLDTSAAGVDRLVMRFSGSGSPAVRQSFVYVNLPATASDNGFEFSATLTLLGEQGMMEILLHDFPTDTSVINTIAIGFARARETGGFTLEEVFLAPTPAAGDYNRDGQVDAQDYQVWRSGYGGFSFQAGLTADGNNNGFIDAADYTFWRDALGGPLRSETSPPDSAASPTPAPSALVLLAACLAGVAWPRTEGCRARA